MDHSLTKIRAFVTVVECGSIKAASEKLDLDPSTLSRQLSGLERDLGQLLIRRSSRKLNITRTGHRVFEHYKKALAEISQVEDICNGAYLQQDIYMTMPRCYGNRAVMPIMEEYISRNPQVRVHVDWSDEQRDLITDRIDIGIRGGFLQSENIVAIKLCELELSIVASPKLLEREPPPQKIQDLVRLPWIKIDLPGKSRLPPLRDGYSLDTRLISKIPLSVSNMEAAIEAASRGLGIAVAEKMAVAQRLERGELIELFPGAILPQGHYWLYVPEGRWIQSHVRDLTQYLIGHLKKREVEHSEYSTA